MSNDESGSAWRQFVNFVAVLSGILLAISEILGLLRHSPYRGIIQTVRDLCQKSVKDGKLHFTLPKKERPPDVETPPPTPGSINSVTPTIGTVASSYFTLKKPAILDRRNQH